MTRSRMTLAEIDKLPASRFRYDNSVRYLRLSTPAYWDTAAGRIVVGEPYSVVGWCEKMPSELMYGREGQFGLMMWSEEYGDVWEHFPMLEDDPADIVFWGKKQWISIPLARFPPIKKTFTIFVILYCKTSRL